MTGEELKNLLAESGVSQSEFARRLGMSQQSFNKALTVADVKSGFLEKIAAALGKDMSFFYQAVGVVQIGDNSTYNNQQGDNNNFCPECSVPSDTELEALEKELNESKDEVCSLKTELDYVKKQNARLMAWLDRFMGKDE